MRVMGARVGSGCENEADAERARPPTRAISNGHAGEALANLASHDRAHAHGERLPMGPSFLASHEEILTAPGCFSDRPGEGSPRPRPGQNLSFTATLRAGLSSVSQPA